MATFTLCGLHHVFFTLCIVDVHTSSVFGTRQLERCSDRTPIVSQAKCPAAPQRHAPHEWNAKWPTYPGCCLGGGDVDKAWPARNASRGVAALELYKSPY
eukprot:3339705-Amphidinium_carterae.1